MCQERTCPSCGCNNWMLVEIPQYNEINAVGQKKVRFMLQCRDCKKVFFSGEYFTEKNYPAFSEDFNPSKRTTSGGRIIAKRT